MESPGKTRILLIADIACANELPPLLKDSRFELAASLSSAEIEAMLSAYAPDIILADEKLAGRLEPLRVLAHMPSVLIMDEDGHLPKTGDGVEKSSYVFRPLKRRALLLALENSLVDFKNRQWLRMNGAAFREIIRNLAVGVLIADADGSVYYANPAAVYITGFTEDEFRRGGLSVLSAEQEGTEIKNVILDAAQDGYPREKEVFFRRKNGTSGWMAVNTAKTARYGAETRVITFIDVTEIKQAEQTLWRYGAHLETRIDGQSKRLREAERMATLGETALMLGHDLKNPLQALLNINFLLKEIYRLSENEARKYLDGHNMAGLLDMFERQSLYMKRIVDNLQIYARREKSSDEVISLVDSVKQVVSLQRDSDVKFSLEIEDGVPRVNLGTTDAQRILTNLIGNAVEAMSGPGTVTIKVYRNKKYSCVRISDTGPGIENGNLGKLFTPLFSTKSKGMGMGLAAVKKLTESYGGSIMSANGLDGGAVFTLQFPFQES